MSTRALAAFAAATFIAAGLPAQARAQARAHDHPVLHVTDGYEECSVNFAPELSQSAFHKFAREFGSVSAFKQSGPASTLGRGRLLVGISVMTFTEDEWSPAWNDTFAHPDAHHPLGSSQQIPKITVRGGVSDNVDVGAYYTTNPLSNYGFVGVDGKYRFMSEQAGAPATMAMRAAYTKTLYVSDMDMHALTADVSIERRLGGIVTPYLGVGGDAVYARETSKAVSLRNETALAAHLLAGVDVTLWRRLSVGAEATLGARPSMQVQVAGLMF